MTRDEAVLEAQKASKSLSPTLRERIAQVTLLITEKKQNSDIAQGAITLLCSLAYEEGYIAGARLVMDALEEATKEIAAEEAAEEGTS